MTLLLQEGCKGGFGSQGAKSRGQAQSGQTAIPSLSWGWIGHTCCLVAVGCDNMSLQNDIQSYDTFILAILFKVKVKEELCRELEAV